MALIDKTMNPQTKRTLLIVGFITLVIGIMAMIWLLFFAPLFRQPTTTNRNANGNSNRGNLPNVNTNRRVNGNANQPLTNRVTQLPSPAEVANGGLTLVHPVTNGTAAEPVIGQDGRVVQYYDPATGMFYRIDPVTGKATPISTQAFPDVQHVTWAPDSGRAVLEFPDDTKVIYDFQSAKQYQLPKEGRQFSFSPNSQNLAFAYIGSDPNQHFLVTTDNTGASIKPVQDLGDNFNQVQVAWSPSNEVVGLYHHSIDANRQEVVFIGQNNENFKSLTVDGEGFKGKWTPDGQKLLYTVLSSATNYNPELYLTLAKGDAIGQGKTDLGLSTYVDKCTFDRNSTFAYCAVPDALANGSGLYPEFSQDAHYTFYTIDLSSGMTRPLANPVDSALTRYSIGSLFLSGDEQSLYFSDSSTQKLYSIRLK